MGALHHVVTSSIVAGSLVLGALSACLSDELKQCADGWLCGASQVCDPRGSGCVLADLVTACDGVADGSPCEVTELGSGTCDAGVCVLASCGDGILHAGEECDDGVGNTNAPNASCRPGCLLPQCGDAIIDDLRGEACDDGNRVDGDGCRPDCGSTEACGNGVIDFAVGELCDDGARFPGDGCSATCSPETPIWTSRAVSTSTSFGQNVVDPTRQRVVRFSDITEEWDGTAWRRLTPRLSPGARSGFALAYDPIRRTTLLFGGFRGQTDRNDLWEWDGFDWRERITVNAPTPRQSARLAFDPVHKVMILFGGVSASTAGPAATYHADTWSWDGEQWRELSPATSPSPRSNFAMATDPVRGQIVLFGGFTYLANYNDTWVWDGDTWVARPQAGPVPPTGAQRDLVFDRESARLVRQPNVGTLARVWSWTGTSWIDDGPTPAPNGNLIGFSSHPTTGNVVAFDSTGTIRQREGGNWISVPLALSPPARADPRLANWSRAGRVVLFGGTADASGAVRLADTWEWDGLAWRDMTSTSGTPPPGGATVAMAEDPIDGVVALVGPMGSPSTWRYDASGWHGLNPTATPAGLVEPIMAFDRGRGVVVLIGAVFSGPLQTWEWDGVTWTDVTPTVGVSPPGRYAAALTYDERLRRVILFGGFQRGVTFGDTWAWDGTSWSMLPGGPLARGRAALGFDRDRARTVLFGGLGGGVPGGPLGDTWEFDGSNWRPLDFEVLVPRRITHAIAADPRGGLMLFGGVELDLFTGSGTTLGDTWRFGYGPDSSTCATGVDVRGSGAGCADPACWHECSPSCAPGMSCAANEPRCGDGTCSSLETCRSCPADCAPCVPRCGDSICEGGEAATCPGDC
ncbi:MAG: hypothetical protein ACKV2T_01345 [Kofleriaceae bacterium]